MDIVKPVHLLTPDDFRSFPVWEYDLDHESELENGETWVTPVETYPVNDLSNRVVGSTIVLRNGDRLLACLSNISLDNETSTREFLTLSLWHQGSWIDLARYFDVEYERRGPANLCHQLGLTVDAVFPIHYDLTEIAVGLASVVRGHIDMAPKRPLTDEERMDLIFDSM